MKQTEMKKSDEPSIPSPTFLLKEIARLAFISPMSHDGRGNGMEFDLCDLSEARQELRLSCSLLQLADRGNGAVPVEIVVVGLE